MSEKVLFMDVTISSKATNEILHIRKLKLMMLESFADISMDEILNHAMLCRTDQAHYVTGNVEQLQE